MEEFLGRGVGGRPALILRGAATLIVGALVLALTTAYMKGVFGDTVTVRAMVDDASGSLTTGADVKSRGVIVGKTSGIRIVESGVEIGLILNKGDADRIPAAAKARILPATVFGTSYVDLVAPAGDKATALRDGQTVLQDDSAETLELQTTLDNVYRVVTAVHPAELSTTLAAISQALEGRGTEIGTSMTRLEEYLARLNPHLPLLREDIRLLADNLETLDRHAPDLFDAVDDGLVTARTVTARKTELTALLTGGGALVSETDRFLTNEEQPIIDTIRQSATIVDALYDGRSGIAPGFRSFVRFGKRGSEALSDGPWLSTDTHIITSGGAQYTGADCPRYGKAQGDNCADGSSTGPLAPSAPDVDEALVKQLRERLDQFDAEGGGIAELLSRPLIADPAGGDQ
ncbi:MAG: MCE family protein [Actinomycetota bacterium]|nr:MCE family protein [Actinomycetota bacterium]